MEIDRINFIEHLAINCSVSLEKFCSIMKQLFELPDFEFGSENETEWGLVEYEGVEYNVSRPYESGTLQKWCESVPDGCNFGISLEFSKDYIGKYKNDKSSEELTERVGQSLANFFKKPVYHHRTWQSTGKNATPNKTFYPNLTKN